MDTPSVPLKQCSRKDKCINPLGSWLPATNEYFAHGKIKGVDKLRCWCKCCAAEWQRNNRRVNKEHCNVLARERRARDIEKAREHDREYYATHPHIFEAYKTRRRESSHRHYLRNTEKVKRNSYERRKRDSGKEKERRRVWRINNPDKAHSMDLKGRARRRGVNGEHTPEDIAVLLKSSRGRCWWCGNKIKSGKYHIDHRIPISRGGTDNPENLCISCPSCNLSKNAKLPQEWNGRLL